MSAALSGYASFRSDPPALDHASHKGLNEDLLVRARRGWTTLYRDERDSLSAVALALNGLAALGAPTEMLEETCRVVEDEVRHVKVCREVILALGVQPEEVEHTALRVLPTQVSSDSIAASDDFEFSLARFLVVGFGIGEGLSAAMFAETLEVKMVPLMQWAYKELLLDEARHGGFGMRLGAWVMRNWTHDQKQSLWPYAIHEMEAFEERVGGPVTEELLAKEKQEAETIAQLEPLGLLKQSRMASLVPLAMERTILPQLKRIGVLPEAS